MNSAPTRSARSVHALYNQLVDKLSLKQFKELMGPPMSYKSKAERAMLVSNSKEVHVLANQILQLIDDQEE